MDFVIVTESENIRALPIGPPGRELEFWIPSNTKWTQLNHGQGEGQVEINGCEWGFYFTNENELTVTLHCGSISADDAVKFAKSVATQMLQTPQYQLILRGNDQ